MDLIRPALVAVAAWMVTSVLAGVLYALYSMSTPITTVAAHVLWSTSLQLAVGLVAAGAAALAHCRVRRRETRRHTLASFGAVAVIAVVIGIVDVLTGTPMISAGLALVSQLAGGALGWLLVSRVIRRSEWRAATRGAYY